ncbi:hypothetical protein Tco_1476578, partial [Tanacetum coccineum]
CCDVRIVEEGGFRSSRSYVDCEEIIDESRLDFLTNSIRATDDYKEYETVFVRGEKRKHGVRETNSPRKSLKVTIRQKKQSTPSIPPPSDDRERDEIAKATLVRFKKSVYY